MDKPLMTTKFVMMQVLAEFAENLGVKRQYAEVLAHVHVSQAHSFKNWQAFLMSQCRLCEKSMSDCPFLHPTEDMAEGSTAAELSTANRASVSYGRVAACPSFKRASAPQE